MTTHRRSMIRTSVATILCLNLGACAPADRVRDTALPASTTAQQSPALKRTPVQAAWWQQFNDPVLTRLIQEALQANPDINTAQASLRSARAQQTIARASLLPGINSNAAARRSGGNDSYNTSLDASWEVDIFGSNRLATRAAQADVQATQASLDDVQASLAAEVASTYVNLRLAQARLGISRQTLASRTETTRLANLKQLAGLTSDLDVEQARLSLGQAQTQLPALESSATQLQHALATLTGKPPEALQSRLAATRPIPSAPAAKADVPANALRQRPDIRAAEARIEAAALRVGEARANLYPGFNLGGSLSLASLSLADLLDTGSIARSLLASVSAPLFDGGKRRQQVEIRDAAHTQAVAAYRKALLAALQDVANTYATLQALREQQPLLANNLALARSAEQLAQLSYNAGTADFQTVLDAQRSVLSAQESQLAAQAEHTQAMISLYKAVGGDW